MPIQVWVDGERAIGTNVAVRVDDAWHLGSVTKSMTATLVARLVDAGALGWDDTIGGALKDTAPDMSEAYRSVTMLHLLSHCSGMPMNIPAEQFYGFSRGVADARGDRQLYARQALAMAPIGPVGETFKYSNSGYIVAAAMLEAKLGQSWETLVRAEVLEPLGLATAGFGAPGCPGSLEHPAGHSRKVVGRSPQAHYVGTDATDNPEVLGPAARVHMSLPDLLRYLIAHRDRTGFLSSRSWNALHTPPFSGDGALGWFVRGKGALWHSGSNNLWYAEVLVDPAAGIAAAAVSNDGDKATTARAVGRALLEAMAAA
jgi:CubicO group peptidase (beta-lactamase class C family)